MALFICKNLAKSLPKTVSSDLQWLLTQVLSLKQTNQVTTREEKGKVRVRHNMRTMPPAVWKAKTSYISVQHPWRHPNCDMNTKKSQQLYTDNHEISIVKQTRCWNDSEKRSNMAGQQEYDTHFYSRIQCKADNFQVFQELLLKCVCQ